MRPSRLKLRIPPRILRIALLGLCVLFASIALWAANDLAARRASYRAATGEYDELAALARGGSAAGPSVSPTGPGSGAAAPSGSAAPPVESAADEPQEHAPPAIDFEALAAINPDTRAWILLPGSAVDYPVVQGEDNDFYLTHTFRRGVNAAGAIFLDAYNSEDFSDKHTMIYGHYMRNGSMFQVLERYKKQGFYEANPEFLLLTPEGAYRCAIFAAYVTTATSAAYTRSFLDDAEMQSFLDTAVGRSLIDTAVTPTPGDRILTLSTCDYTFHDARMVVQAVLRAVQ